VQGTMASGFADANPFRVPPGLVGITGGMGVGKSTVVRILRTFGAAVLDADHVAHGLYAPGKPAYRAMIRRWGHGILAADGTIDRGHVARCVFQTPSERRWLNQLLHPGIRGHIRARAQAERGLLFCAIPLLFEVGWQNDMWRTVAVWCPPGIQVDRLHGRGWSDHDIQDRLAVQMSADEKLHRADYGLINSGTLWLLQRQCEILWRELEREVTAKSDTNDA